MITGEIVGWLINVVLLACIVWALWRMKTTPAEVIREFIRLITKRGS